MLKLLGRHLLYVVACLLVLWLITQTSEFYLPNLAQCMSTKFGTIELALSIFLREKGIMSLKPKRVKFALVNYSFNDFTNIFHGKKHSWE